MKNWKFAGIFRFSIPRWIKIIFHQIWQFVYLYLGIGHIRWMIKKPMNHESRQKPSNFFLWLIGIHFTVLGFADQQYGQKLAAHDSMFNTLRSEFADSDDKNFVLQQMIYLRDEPLPYEPTLWPLSEFFSPYKTFTSIYDHADDGLNRKINQIIDNYSSELDRLNLSGLKKDLMKNPKYLRISNSYINKVKYQQNYYQAFFNQETFSHFLTLNRSKINSLELNNTKLHILFNSSTESEINSYWDGLFYSSNHSHINNIKIQCSHITLNSNAICEIDSISSYSSYINIDYNSFGDISSLIHELISICHFDANNTKIQISVAADLIVDQNIVDDLQMLIDSGDNNSIEIISGNIIPYLKGSLLDIAIDEGYCLQVGNTFENCFDSFTRY